MGDREFIFDVAELATIAIPCPKCRNLITFNATTDESFGVPLGCLTCHYSWDGLREVLVAFRQFYKQAGRAAGVQLRARVDVPRTP